MKNFSEIFKKFLYFFVSRWVVLVFMEKNKKFVFWKFFYRVSLFLDASAKPPCVFYNLNLIYMSMTVELSLVFLFSDVGLETRLIRHPFLSLKIFYFFQKRY
jgi:hypothetical protein